MADALIFDNLRNRYQILTCKFTRTGTAEQLACQIANILEFLTEVDQHKRLFSAPEYQIIQTSVTRMVSNLSDGLRELSDPRREDLLATESETPSGGKPPLRLHETVEMIAQFVAKSDQCQEDYPAPQHQLLQTSGQTIFGWLRKAQLHRKDTDPETPSSEMHRALQVPDVVWMIVSQLDPRPHEGMAELAALARCGPFHGLALDALWRHQETIQNLINCMPEGLWVVEQAQWRRDTLRLCRPVQVTDWDRVLQYSHRVRSLSIEPYRSVSLSQVFEVLHQGIPGDYLLPNLETLQWRPGDTIEFANINIFLGPKITSIRLQTLEIPQLSFLATLARRFPDLTEVTIEQTFSPSGRHPEIQNALSVFVHGLRNIRSLHLQYDIDAGAIMHIGGLSTLETLHISPSITPFSLAGLPEGSLFHHLRSASFWCPYDGQLAAIASFVRSWAYSPLRSFAIKSYRYMTADETAELYSALSAHCSHDTLKTLKFTVRFFLGGVTASEYTIPGRALKSLFCFTNLVTVCIRSANGYLLDDEIMAQLAAAWPRIEELRLEVYDHLHPCGTLLGLQALARHCPNLHTLQLTLDASSVPPYHPDPCLKHPALVKLDVGYSLISNAFDVARFLSATFPNVTQTFTEFDSEDSEDEGSTDSHDAVQAEYRELWKEVNTLLPGLQDLRAKKIHEVGRN